MSEGERGNELVKLSKCIFPIYHSILKVVRVPGRHSDWN